MADWRDDVGFSLTGGDSGKWWEANGSSFDLGIPDFNYDMDIPSFSLGSVNDWSQFSQPDPNFNFSNQPMGSGIQPGFGGGAGSQQPMGWGGAFSNPQSLLGLGQALAVLGGTLAGGGKKQTTSSKLNTAQKAQYEQAQRATSGLQPFAQGQTPLQQQQMQLLQAITGGTGLAQPYAQAVEQAFEPQMGSLYEQATAAGRKRGFHDAPATSPPGGAVLGPGLSNLQGQIAQAKLNMMMGLPGMFNAPINQQAQMAQAFSGGQGSLFNAYPGSQTVSAPLAPQVGNIVGGALGGLGAGIGQAQQQQFYNNQQQQLLNMFQNRQQPQGGYSFENYIPPFRLT